jgi:hypothetical protein
VVTVPVRSSPAESGDRPSAGGGRPPAFVSRFLLPLVKGGTLRVGRPLGARALAAMITAFRSGRRRVMSLEDMAEEDAVAELARLRHGRARALLVDASLPPLDESSLRLGLAVHNLLGLLHPDLARRSLERRQERIVAVTVPIADLGPPASAEEVVRRHSLLARLGEITRTEHVVEFWAGRRRFVGRPPPAHLVALPRMRRVSTTWQRRVWLKEIGVPSCARSLWITLQRASPLGEALDPLRLDTPPAWERILPVLRFPPLARLVVGRLVEVGLEPAGGALARALQRFSSARDAAGAGATREQVAFAVRLLAHAFWLDHLYQASSPPLTGVSDLGLLLAAAFAIDPRLVWPPDVALASPLGAPVRARLERFAAEARARAPDRLDAALALCRFAASGDRSA